MSTDATTVINVRIDRKTKQQAAKAVKGLGLDISSAIKMFLHKVIQTNSIPFRVGKMNDPRYIAEVRREVEWAIKHGKRYSAEELISEWKKEDAGIRHR